ncbi:MAG: type II secretion system protein GspG [bacterium]
MKFLLILVLILAPIQIYGQIYTIQVNEYQSNGWEYKVRADPFTDEIISTVSKAAKDGPDTSVSKPVLYIRSNGDIYIDWKRFISKNGFDQPIRYRFDKGEIENKKVATSTKANLTFLVIGENLNSYLNFIKQIRDSMTLAVGVEDSNGAEYVAVFDLLGSSKAFSLIEEEGESQESQFLSIQETKTSLRDLETALSLYEAHNGRFPTTEQTLSALINLPNIGGNYENWKGPYLQGSEIPSDGWGRSFEYTSDGTRYVILSLGADGKNGGSSSNADISALGKLYWSRNVDN